ncbi:GntR family transcriptional regulator [Chelativorans sp.]|uniref:GntR family transcriptional regulator n=1 Tax=Chelativorans sp. TaxID=2203393 RepID=UPI0028116982|nr:GntR family transcriptional regulator [Chelativorans sp.]
MENRIETRRPYAIVHEALLTALSEDRTGAEIVISVSSVAEHFAVSRPPVERALRMLVAEGLVERTSGGKFIRPGARENPVPVKTVLDRLPLDVVSRARQKGSWQPLYDQVERMIVRFLPFGSYKLIESAMADYFGVSRTVTNDVLHRLEERGLVRRGEKGRWIVEQLSQHHLSDIYQLRRLLEPAALVESAPQLDAAFLEGAVERIHRALAVRGNLYAEELQAIERDLHTHALSHCRNARLLAVIRQAQVLHITYLYLPNQSASEAERTQYLSEHLQVFEALAREAFKVAEQALVFHLESSEKRASERLRQASDAEAEAAPPFLLRQP